MDWLKNFFGSQSPGSEPEKEPEEKPHSTSTEPAEQESSKSPAIDLFTRKHDGHWRCVDCGETFVNKPFNQCPRDFGTLLSLKKVSKRFFTAGDRYKIRRPIGFREATRCYLAHDKESDREVIVQFLFTNYNPDDKTRTRFVQAAERLIGLEHPNIYSVYDANDEANGTYFVGELARGVTAEDLFRESAKLTPKDILSIIDSALSGLDHAHANEIYHCSLQLADILVSKMEDGSLSSKVMDFGIATRMLGGLDWQGSQDSETRTRNVYGNAGSMAPEVIRGAAPTPKSDVYSVGCCLYEALTGSKVFEREAELFTLFAHINDEPEPFDPSLNIPSDLEEVVFKCLEKEPDNRFANIKELGEHLQSLQETSK